MDTIAPEIEERYVSAIAAYQLACGGGIKDMSPVQFGKFRALEAAEGDANLARHLWFARYLCRQGRISDRLERGGQSGD